MMRRIRKQNCRNSLSPIRQTHHQSRHTNHHKIEPIHAKERKYYSTANSIHEESPLRINKEMLRKKVRMKNKLGWRQGREKRKQATQHYNYTYIEWSKMKRECINWIIYNITIGIAIICEKMKKDLNVLRWKYSKVLEQEVNSANNQINNIIKTAKLYSAHPPINLKEVLRNYKKFDFAGMGKSKNLKQVSKLQVSNKTNCSSGLASPTSLSPLKESVCKLNSYFCMLSRRIKIDKEDNLINQFIERRHKSTQNKFKPNDIIEFNQIMKINQNRCELMNQIMTNVHSLKSYESNMLIDQSFLRKMGEIDLMRDMANLSVNQQQVFVNGKLKSYKNFLVEVIEPKPSQNDNPFKSKQATSSNDCVQSINSRPKRKKKVNYRSSIQSYVPHKESYGNVVSKISQFWRDKPDRVNTRQGEQNEKLKKIQNELQRTNLRNRKNEVNPIEPVEKKAKKKIITFSNEPQHKNKKKLQSKMKSAVSIKSNHQLTWEELQNQQWHSLRSIKSFKSLKSLGSISIISLRHLKSFKTQRELRYLNGRFRKIVYGRRNRTIIFKHGQQERKQTQKDFLLTTDHRVGNSSKVSLESYSKLQFNQIQSQKCQGGQKQEKSKVGIESRISLRHTDTYLKRSIGALNTANEQVQYTAKQQQAMIINFITQFKKIEGQGNMSSQKELILAQLQKMYEGKIISTQIYEHYKALFNKVSRNRNNKRIKLQRADQQEQNMTRESFYNVFSKFRKDISKTTELNQINKYYYNISQFQCEDQQIKQTKQVAKKEDFFFIIRNSTQNRSTIKRATNQFVLEKYNQNLLCQKSLQ